MRKTLLPIIIFMAGSTAVASPATLDSIGRKLSLMPVYAGNASFEVLLPMADEPVNYSISLESIATPKDTLSPCQYLIDWTLPTPSGRNSGFSAYYEGNHFRYRDNRLQEYHAEWDAEPFAPSGRADKGVQIQSQFADLLPQMIGRRLMEMAADPTYTYTIQETPSGRLQVKGVQTVAGYDCLEFRYEFEPATLMPLAIHFENNPGLVSEQSVDVSYRYTDASGAKPVTMERLVELYPKAFEQDRQSSFSLATLPGRWLPEFSANTTSGKRYTHHRTDDFAEPTLIVVLDESVASTPDVIVTVREALDEIPDEVDVLWAFISNNPDRISELTGELRQGETALIGARGLARDCGVADTPSIIFCNPRAKVTDVEIGYNKDLRSNVIQKTMIARYYSDSESELIND